MKRIALLCLLVGFMATGVQASTLVRGDGNWNDPCNWTDGTVPPYELPADDGDEIKITQTDPVSGVGSVITVDHVQLNYTTTKITVAGAGPVGPILKILPGGYLGSGRQLTIGPGNATSAGTVGSVVQTGGQMDLTNVGKMILGYSKLNTNTGLIQTGTGHYTISGGSLTGNVAGGRVYIGGNGAAGSTGTMRVIGDGATITLGGDMYVATDSSSGSNPGTGTIQFDFNDVSGLVTQIAVDELIVDPMDDAAALATLIVNVANLAAADTVLIESTGSSHVQGAFDHVIMNGVGSRYMVLGGNTYFLSYAYDADTMTDTTFTDYTGNDVALVLVPEPATLVMLAIGGLIAAKRRR